MLPLTALDLDGWAARESSRAELPVLLRRLVHGRPITLTHIDVPAYDSVNEGGWDGQMRAQGADPWVPDGASFWELTCEGRGTLPRKASSDYDKRTRQMSPAERAQSTFVFVTARRWPGKARWLAARDREDGWGQVRVYDAETLVQWLETTPAALAWMQSRLGRPSTDLTAPEEIWREWSGVTKPVLPFAIFDEALAENRERLGAFFAKPDARHLDVAADTRAEAAAFAAGVLSFTDLAGPAGSRAVVARTRAGLDLLKTVDAPLTLLVASAEVEAAIGGLPPNVKILVATDKSKLDYVAGAAVEPLTWEAFHRLGRELDLDPAASERLDRDCGRRITILRRRLAFVGAVRHPAWSTEGQSLRPLVALALVGGWNWTRPADRAVLAGLADLEPEAMEVAIGGLAALEDPPIFTVAEVGGVISRPDALTALRGKVTGADLDRFFALAREVFSEPDPALELAEDKRWMANVYGKTRLHSGRLRKNLADGVTYLAVEGDALVPGYDCKGAARRLVRDLFDGLGEDRWLHLRTVLQALAEAAPGAFLDEIEKDLPFENDDRGVWRLVKPVSSAGFGDLNYRVELLWALERVGWSADLLPRVAMALAAFCGRPLPDNTSNRPDNTLAALLHPIWPQTAAPRDLQARLLKTIDRRFPDVGWAQAMRIVDQRFRAGHYSVRPRFRADAVGQGHQARGDGLPLFEAARDIVLGRGDPSTTQVLELIDKSPQFAPTDRERLWDAVEAWAAGASETDRAKVRDALRQLISRRPRRHPNATETPEDSRARQVHDRLLPEDPVLRHQWLFAKQWVRIETDEAGQRLDHRQSEARVADARRAAVTSIWAAGGLEPLVEFARQAGAPDVVARSAFEHVSELEVSAVTGLLLDASLDAWAERPVFVSAVLHQLEAAALSSHLAQEMANWKVLGRSCLPLLLAAPAELATWALVGGLEPADREAYWRAFKGYCRSDDPAALEHVCTWLLEAKRPRAAFSQGELYCARLSPELVVRILEDLAYVEGPADEQAPVSGHEVAEYLQVVEAQSDMADTVLQLEFTYCRHLEDTERGLSALSRALAKDPTIFVHGLSVLYKPDDGSDDVTDPKEQKIRAQNAERWYSVFEHCTLPPGADDQGQVTSESLSAWLAKANDLLVAAGRRESGFRMLGQILARTRRHVEDLWPGPGLAEALEPWVDEHLGDGLYLGIVNSRGVHTRSQAGGTQERELAEQFRRWRRAIELEAPRLAAVFERVASSYDDHAVRGDDWAALQRASPG